MILKTIFITSIALASATRAEELSLTVEGAASYAVSHNPALSAARLRIEEARGRLDAAGLRSNPEVEFEFRQNPRAPERSFALAWMQKFPVTARLHFEKAISRAELAAAESEVRDTGRKLAGEVRVAAISLLALSKERELRKLQIANSEELVKLASGRVKSGEASAVDAALVELESKQLGTQLFQLDAKRAALLGELRPLLGVGAGAELEISGTLDKPEDLPAKGTSPGARGDYLAAQATAEAAKQSVDLAKANKWADFSAGFSAEHSRTEDMPDGLKNDMMLGLKFSLPLPIWNNNDGRVREAAATAARTEKEVHALAMQISSEAAAARAEMAALSRVVADIDEKLIPLAKQIEEQLRAGYASGQTPLAEVIRARGKRFEFEAQRLDALRDYHLARAKYQTAIGDSTAAKKTKSRK